MKSKRVALCLLWMIPGATALIGQTATNVHAASVWSARIPEPARQGVIEAYGRLPLIFEANQGQTGSEVKFLSRGPGYSLFLTSTETVLSLNKPEDGAVLRMRLAGSNPSPQVTGQDELPGKSNYFIGNDQAKWHSKVPTY